MGSNKISKFLSLILRHNPESIGVTADPHGWVSIDRVLKGISKEKNINFTISDLEELVATDNKGRYVFNEDKSKIRACQGHSISVDLGLNHVIPVPDLYHGTTERFIPDIKEMGILPMSRQYVHLNPDFATALKVGARHGKPMVLRINSALMHKKSHKFYLSENYVWLRKYLLSIFRFLNR